MKKIVLCLILALTLLLAACAPSEPGPQGSEATTVPNETQATTEQTTAPADLTPEEIYDDYLQKLCVRLNKIIVDDTYLDGLNTEPGMAGVAEMAYHGGVQLLDKYGYTIQDINGDEVPELIICAVDQEQEGCVGKDILCIFTVADSQMKLLVEGWSRNTYHMLDDGTLYQQGSNGASNSVYAIYMVAQTNDVLCTHCYYTGEDASGAGLFLYNTTGETDPAKGEPVEGGEDAFYAMVDGISARITALELTAFSAIAE